ncbi:hypothetical protein JCM8547_005233 [Rhodosporidiobolus lusitaniae]
MLLRRLPPRLPSRRSLSTSATLLYPPRRAPAPQRKEAAEIVLDDLGREVRVLKPLKPLPQPAPSTRKILASKKKKVKKEPEEGELDTRGMTALEKAVRTDLAKHPDAILLTQVGSFFESYFEQARLVSQILGIKLTSKVFGRLTSSKSSENSKARHPFAGFPLAQLDKHVSTLVSEGHKVVIVEEYKDRASDVITRKVSRIVSPGTGVDEAFVQPERMNYVLALGFVDGKSVGDEIGMAYRDLSTGASFTRVSKLTSLRDDIRLVQPKEVIVDAQLAKTKLGQRVVDLLEGEKRREGLAFSSTSTEAVPSSFSPVRSSISAAEDVLLAYISHNFPATPPPRTPSVHVDLGSVLQMDAVTLQSLEVRESLRGTLRGSLLGAVKRTVTPGGQRMLSERLCNPSTSISTINSRLSLISLFLHDPPAHPSASVARHELRQILKKLDDTPRLLQRLAFRRPNAANDLLGLKRTMRQLEALQGWIVAFVPLSLEAARAKSFSTEQHEAISGLLERLGEYGALAEEIEQAVDEEALEVREEEEQRKAEVVADLGEGAWAREKEVSARTREEGLWGEGEAWVIRPKFSTALTEHHSILDSLRQQADALERSFRDKYRSPNLTLRNVIKIGPGLHVIAKDGVAKLEADGRAVLAQKHASTRVYVVQEWVDLYRKIAAEQQKIAELEKAAIKILVARTLERYRDLLQTADALAELDVSLGLAELASTGGWVRPVVDESKSLEIVGGRHPTVENALLDSSRSFDPNDVRFDHPDDAPQTSSLVHVLTGPNMAGKSTYLRQTALIVLLAQAGSYVPAESARIGICDRIFSRVGARDELDRDRSTFMIEMDEATSILETAGSKSLVLLDELGRGTSPLDGISIAFSAIEHLTLVNRSRTLFATHFHKLGSLLGYDEKDVVKSMRGNLEGVEFWCTDVEDGETFVRFPHTIRRGLNIDSGGLTIARLAGMPDRAIRTAQKVRDQLMAEDRGMLM